jgi:hypothetical protein
MNKLTRFIVDIIIFVTVRACLSSFQTAFFTPLRSAAFSMRSLHSPQFPFTEMVLVVTVDCA